MLSSSLLVIFETTFHWVYSLLPKTSLLSRNLLFKLLPFRLFIHHPFSGIVSNGSFSLFWFALELPLLLKKIVHNNNNNKSHNLQTRGHRFLGECSSHNLFIPAIRTDGKNQNGFKIRLTQESPFQPIPSFFNTAS